MSGDEIDYDALATRLTDSKQVIRAVEAPLRDDDATAAGRDFLLREFGSEEAIMAELRPGRPRIGKQPDRGPSPTVRGRISEQDFAAVKQLEEQTGKTQSELVREGIQLVIERYRTAS